MSAAETAPAASTVDALAASLRARIDRYNAALDMDEHADSTEILAPQTAALRRDLLVAALTMAGGRIAELDGVDAGPFHVAAWTAEFRDSAFTTAGNNVSGRDEGANAMRLFLVVDHVQPDLVPSHQRARIAAMTARGLVLDLSYRERELAEVLLSDEQAGLAAINVAVALLHRSLARDTGGSALWWNTLMRALWRRYTLSQDISDVAAAIDAAERSLPFVDGTSRAIVLRQIGVMEQERYDRTGATSSLHRCVTVLREALDLTPTVDPGHARTLVLLSIALRTRGSHERSPDDLDRAVALTREALADTSLSAAERASSMSMLALALHARFELTCSEPDLAEAVSVAREAADVDADEDRGVRLGNLGLVLGTQHHHARDRDALTELVAVARRAVALPGSRHQKGRALGQLSVALTYGAGASGRLEDLNEAIKAGRGAVAALAGHPEQANHLNSLANALYERFRRTHSVDDLDECVEVARRSTASAGDDPRRAGRLSTLAGALDDRYQLRGSIDDLVEAVAAGEEAVLSTPASAAAHATLLSNLSNARRALAERTGQLSDADAAIQVAARAASIEGDQAAAPIRLGNLASCHVVRHRITGNLADLDRAVALLREALAYVAQHDPIRCTYLSELGQRLVERYTAANPDHRDTGMLREAIGLLRTATSLTAAPAITRVRAAGRWSNAAAEHGLHVEAAEGDAAAVRLLPLAAWHGLDRHSQERQLSLWNPIVASAAARAIDRGRNDEAVELLEQGRSVLWGHQLGRHVDLTALRAVQPELADRLDQIRSLDRPNRPR